MADVEVDKGSTGFERFLYFVIPVLFTIVLLGVLYIFADSNMREKAIELGNKVPFLERILPDSAAERERNAVNPEQLREQNVSEKIGELTQALAEAEQALESAASEKAALELQLAEAQAGLDAQTGQLEQQQLDDEEYQNRIASLANMYAKITPSKAAPILQSMALEEMVLILDAMRADDRVRILEKMTPQTAADATMMLKDAIPAKDRQIAALQARLNSQETQAEQTTNNLLNETELGSTFSTMPAASAAELLLAMAEVNQPKVLRILNLVSNNARAGIIAQMSTLNKDYTATLVSKLLLEK